MEACNIFYVENGSTQPKVLELTHWNMEAWCVFMSLCLNNNYQFHPEARIVFRHAKHEHRVQEGCGYEGDETSQGIQPCVPRWRRGASLRTEEHHCSYQEQYL